MHATRVGLCFITIIFYSVCAHHFHDDPTHDYAREKRNFITNPFDPNFGASINAHIQHQVRQNMAILDLQLAPIHRMNARNNMGQGLGGTTFITYGGEKIRIVRNGISYVCPSTLVRSSNKRPQCTSPVTLNNNSDPCCLVGSGISKFNDFYCLGNTVYVTCSNGNCTCVGGTGYTTQQLRVLCGSTFGTPQYTQYEYYQDITLPNGVDFNSMKSLGVCENNDPNVCIWHDTGIPGL